MITRRTGQRSGLRRRVALAVLALCTLATALVACRTGARDLPFETEEGKPPNVLLITVDTLRADHLGVYGYPIPTSPSVDGLGAEGVVFRRCVATAPETSPAVASILTGLYQHHHRVPNNLAMLPEDITTLAEHLRAAGYTTAGFQGNPVLVEYYGFSQGFDFFESFPSPWSLTSSDDRGATLAVDWLRTKPKEPWFLWIHFMDPHGPYWSAQQWWSEDFQYPPSFSSDEKPVPLGDTNFGLGIIPRYQRIEKFAHLSYYIRRYDGEIHFTDAQVGNIVAALSLFGYRDKTVVVLTADHGESLTEHREYLQHGWYLYDTTLHVPMIFSWPGRLQHRVVDTQVSGVDLVPSVLHIAGIDEGGVQLDGESFAPLLMGGEASEELPAFAVGPRSNQPFAISQAGWKLIHSPAGKPDDPNAEPRPEGYGTPERVELYRIADDPGETRDLAAGHEKVSGELLKELRDFEKTFQDRLAASPAPYVPPNPMEQIIKEAERSLESNGAQHGQVGSRPYETPQ